MRKKSSRKKGKEEKVTTETAPKADSKKWPILSEKSLAEDDYVLFAALNILKGAAFWQPKP